MERVTLPYCIPDIRKATGYKAGVRPYREGGVRLERQKEQNGKTVYHNYGHGGAGISIAYGCVRHVIDTLFLPEQVPLGEEIAVLGAGIVGLTTAYLLVNQGYRVSLYAELTPFEKLKGGPEITTTVAAGYWMPLKVGNKGETVAQAISTWNHYSQVCELQRKTGKQLGVTKLPVYALNDEAENFHFRIPGVIEPKDVLVTFGDRVDYRARVFDSFVIETEIYCQFLRDEMERSGRYSFINATIKSKAEVLSLKPNHIFNCLGFGSRVIFGDEKVRGIKGHVMRFDLREHERLKDFILVMGVEGGLHLQVPQHQSGNFMMGVTFEEGREDTAIETARVDFLIERARDFFQRVEGGRITPKL